MEKTKFRSGLEKRWHEELEKLGIEHHYEAMKIPMTIDGIETTYTPDFILPGQGVVIEVKGSHKWAGKSMQKTRTLAKMGYIVLKCVDEGKFNFIDNDNCDCFVLLCPNCSKHLFACSVYEECPFCKNVERKEIVRDGKTGITAWKKKRQNEKWLFDKSAFDRINNTLSKDVMDLHKGVYEKLCGNPRHIDYDSSMISKLNDLFDKYPNMDEVRDFVFSSIDTLSIRLNSNISFPPILLEGSPGCGKTSFATELGKILANDNYRKIEVSNGIAGFTLTGTDRGYSSAEPGLILQAMFTDGFSPIKNPVIIIDEIDKCDRSSHPVEPVFHTLLERKSAQVYTDNFFGVPVDASRVNYIGLCNDSSAVSKTILDRFKHFKIRDYTAIEMRDIVIPCIYRDWLVQENLDPTRIPKNLSLEIREIVHKRSDGKPRKIIPVLNELLRKYLYTDPETSLTISLFTKKELKKWQSLCGEENRVIEEDEEDEISDDGIGFLNETNDLISYLPVFSED